MKTNPKRFALLMVAILLFASAGAAFSQTQQWPMVNADRGRSSWAELEDVLYPPLKETAMYGIPGLVNPGHDMMTVLDSLLCIGISNTGENLFAMFDVSTGDTLWTFSLPSSVGSVGFVPAQNDTLVLCGGQSGPGLYALDRRTGEQKWFNELGSLFSRHPILDGEAIFIVKGSLQALRVSNGTRRWGRPYSSAVTPAVDDESCYVCSNGKAAKMNKVNTFLFWEVYNSDTDFSTLALYDEALYTHTNDSLVARDKADGGILWAYPLPDCDIIPFSQNAVAVSDSILCYSLHLELEDNGRLLALNRFDGSYLWHHDFTNEFIYSPTIANGVVYVTDEPERDLYGFNLKTGEQIFYDNSHDYRNQPIVADHKLYVGSRNGVVVFENDDTGVAETGISSPETFSLEQNFPNPFNPHTTIRYTLPGRSRVRVMIFNIQGEQVRTAMQGLQDEGTHHFIWRGEDDSGNPVPAGIYFCRVEAAGMMKTIRIVLMK